MSDASRFHAVTWNINSVRLRLPLLLDFLSTHTPDVVSLQEIKTVNETFPFAEIEALGYNCAVYGQKSYNGVALLSKTPFEDVTRGLPPLEEDEPPARYIEAVVPFQGSIVRVTSIYAPNGNPVYSDAGDFSAKYAYKLRWHEALNRHAQALLKYEEPLLLSGDFNIIPAPEDVHDPAAWEGDALYRPESRAVFHALKHQGFIDAVRICAPFDEAYTFWDYQVGAWAKNNGIRIDHHLLSSYAANHLSEVILHKNERSREKPSDHVPVSVYLNLPPSAL
jgi:exodeoxyribonuclease III